MECRDMEVIQGMLGLTYIFKYLGTYIHHELTHFPTDNITDIDDKLNI